MAFALFYNRQDLSPIAAEITRATLPQGDKQIADRIWRGGFDGWDAAPVAPPEYLQGDADTRIVVIDDAQVAKQDMIDLLLRCCNDNMGAVYMCAIASDMVTSCVEPWPVA